MFKTMDEALNDLYNRIAPKENRQRLKDCLKELDNPEKTLKTIQIAGTNGKGSTTNYVSQILRAAGYKVGMFTSPHLIVHNDRIRINDVNIPDEVFLQYLNAHDEVFKKYGLNMFEIDFIIAALYYVDEQVDFAVFEAGLGGRLDATSEVEPLVNCITNIGMDHMALLGDTKEKIAYEKAGILKKGVTCISAEMEESCRDVFNREAQKVGANMKYVEPLEVNSYPPLVLNYHKLTLELGDVALYQRYNAATALGIIEELLKQGVCISDEAIKEGMQHKWAGRFEKISKQPLIYVDGAHNEEGVEALCESIKAFHKPTYILFSALKDKPAEKMIADLKGVAKEVIATTFVNKRARRKEDYPNDIIFFDDYKEAIRYLESKDGLLIITGSLYFISLVKEYYAKQERHLLFLLYNGGNEYLRTSIIIYIQEQEESNEINFICGK